MVNVSFSNETIALIDRHRVGVHGGPPTKRAAWVAWATKRFIATLAEQEQPTPKPRKIVRRPAPTTPLATPAAESIAHEGARLKEARGAAGLAQTALAYVVSVDGVEVSRQQVDRAERAATLDQWPALRAWLLEHGPPAPT